MKDHPNAPERHVFWWYGRCNKKCRDSDCNFRVAMSMTAMQALSPVPTIDVKSCGKHSIRNGPATPPSPLASSGAAGAGAAAAGGGYGVGASSDGGDVARVLAFSPDGDKHKLPTKTKQIGDGMSDEYLLLIDAMFDTQANIKVSHMHALILRVYECLYKCVPCSADTHTFML
jgi:hypothetical protein